MNFFSQNLHFLSRYAASDFSAGVLGSRRLSQRAAITKATPAQTGFFSGPGLEYFFIRSNLVIDVRNHDVREIFAHKGHVLHLESASLESRKASSIAFKGEHQPVRAQRLTVHSIILRILLRIAILVIAQQRMFCMRKLRKSEKGNHRDG